MNNSKLESYKSELLLHTEKYTDKDWDGDVMDTGTIVIYSPSTRKNRKGEMSIEDINTLENIFDETVSKFGLIIPPLEEKRNELLKLIKNKS